MKKLLNPLSILLIIALLLLYWFCCRGACKLCPQVVDLTGDNYVAGFVALEGTSEEPTGLIRLFTDEHSSPACLYTYSENLQLHLRDSVFVQIENINGVSYAKNAQTERPEKCLSPSEWVNSDNLNLISMNLHNAQVHKVDQYHKRGHIMTISGTETGTDNKSYVIVEIELTDDNSGNSFNPVQTMKFAAPANAPVAVDPNQSQFFFLLSSAHSVTIAPPSQNQGTYPKLIYHSVCEDHFGDYEPHCIE